MKRSVLLRHVDYYLEELPGYAREDIQGKLPESFPRPGDHVVYFLWQAARLVYVGHSDHLRRRLGGHRAKPWDSVTWLTCPDHGAALATERGLTRALAPPLNTYHRR